MEDQSLPYKMIPDYPVDYSPGNIVSRMIDGLGYRYYWATEGLRKEDLNFDPTEESRNTLQTLEHIYQLSVTIVNTANNIPNKRPLLPMDTSYQYLRKNTLINLQQASQLFANKNKKQIANIKVVFESNAKKSEFEFWHAINGFISDAIYHTGQIVSFRRMSGNPINSTVNVFMGKNDN